MSRPCSTCVIMMASSSTYGPRVMARRRSTMSKRRTSEGEIGIWRCTNHHALRSWAMPPIAVLGVKSAKDPYSRCPISTLPIRPRWDGSSTVSLKDMSTGGKDDEERAVKWYWLPLPPMRVSLRPFFPAMSEERKIMGLKTSNYAFRKMSWRNTLSIVDKVSRTTSCSIKMNFPPRTFILYPKITHWNRNCLSNNYILRWQRWSGGRPRNLNKGKMRLRKGSRKGRRDEQSRERGRRGSTSGSSDRQARKGSIKNSPWKMGLPVDARSARHLPRLSSTLSLFSTTRLHNNGT